MNRSKSVANPLKSLSLIVLIALFSTLVAACGDPGWPPELTKDQSNALFASIRAYIEEKPAQWPNIEAAGYILSAYDGRGDRVAIAGKTLSEAADMLKSRLAKNGYAEYYLVVNIIRDVDGFVVGFLASNGFGYEKGQQGIAYKSGDQVRLYDPTYVASHDWEFGKTSEQLEKGHGIDGRKLDLPNGLSLLTCESYTEPEPGKEPLAMFRANVLVEKVDLPLIRQTIRIGADQLLELQQSSGRFAYTYHVGNDRMNTRTYNLLRHAGTCYALFQVYEYTGDERYLQAAKHGMKWLRKRIKSPEWDRNRAYPVYHNKAKLGGAALSLMAYCQWMKVDPEFNDAPIMHKLANHVIKMQNDDGSFESYYAWDGKPVKRRHSIYYPGESILGLIRYYKLFPEKENALATAIRGSDYLVDKRWMIAGIEVNVPPDAWLMMALHELWQVNKKESYKEYCLRIADVMASDQVIRFVPDADYFGGYFPFPPQVTPAGSRSEGLTGAYLMTMEAGQEKTWLFDTVMRGARFQISMQIRPEFDHLFPNPKVALGTFRHNPQRNINRIDYNQHNISGLIALARILEAKKQ